MNVDWMDQDASLMEPLVKGETDARIAHVLSSHLALALEADTQGPRLGVTPGAVHNLGRELSAQGK